MSRMTNWAIASNTTIAPLAARLKTELQSDDLTCNIFVSQYGEAVQQILQPGSPLYASKPDVLVLYGHLSSVTAPFPPL